MSGWSVLVDCDVTVLADRVDRRWCVNRRRVVSRSCSTRTAVASDARIAAVV
jgi:hypothetical protein